MRCRVSSKSIVFLLLCFLTLHQVFAQTHFKHFSAADGLPSNNVSAVYQDSLGFIWIGTTKGLVRYDGYSYKFYNLGENLAENPRNPHVLCLGEDSHANLWIGTAEHGLFYKDGRTGYINRLFQPEYDKTCRKPIKHLFVDSQNIVWIIYDDYTLDGFYTESWQLEQFYHDAADSCSIASDRLGYARGNFFYVPAICEDNQHRIWFGTEDSGISRYDPLTGCFTHYRYRPDDSTSLSSNQIKCILQDRRKNIWIASARGGIDRYVPELDSFQHIPLNFSEAASLSRYSCDYMIEDELGRLWLTTFKDVDELDNARNPEEDAALFCFDVEKNTFVRYSYNPNTPDLPFPDYAFPLFAERDGVVWCYKITTILERYDGYTKDVSVVKASPDISNSFRGYTVTSLMRDHSDMVWIGTWLTGINKYNPYAQSFINYRRIPNDSTSLQGNRINVLYESKKNPGKLYVGAENSYGLSYIDLESGSVCSEKLRGNPEHIKNLFNIASICSDAEGTLWVACFADRLYQIQNNHISLVSTNPESGRSFGVANLFTVSVDNSDMIWVGTWPSGVRCINKRTGVVTAYSFNKDDTTSLSNNSVQIIYTDKFNDVWIGTVNGLNLFNRAHRSFQRFLHGVSVKHIFEDNKNRLWLGTLGDGLILFNRQTKEFVKYDTDNDLAGNVIWSIVQDQTGYLWIAADGGLTRFDPDTKDVANFYKEHGLPTVKFHLGVSLASDGRIYSGTQEDGIVAFDPNNVKLDTIPPNVVLSDILLFDESLPVGGTSPLQEDVSIAKEIEFKHWQNDISFEMTALHYAYPEKNTYQYWLENYDKDWLDNGTNRTARYTNLDPGDYIFHAKAANADGFWNDASTSLRIVIHPPWWATTWAYGFYVLLLGGLVVIFWKLQLRRLKLRQDIEKHEFEKEQLKKIDHLKSQFFANISHEFRTPITLIKGPLEKLFTIVKDKTAQNELSIMRRNANRLHRLINQLLDISALEAGKLELNPTTQDVVRLVRYFVQSFESQAKLKGITLSFASDTNELFASVDKSKMEDIVYNLVSNALKFTSKGGAVDVHVSKRQKDSENAHDWFEIRVTDAGIGIAPDRIGHIFDRFYQVDDSYVRQAEGSGIGLSLTKELVELHGGSITVESAPGVGSLFFVRLPVGHVDTSEIKNEAVEFSTVIEELAPITEEPTASISKGKPLVLIVEDNPDLRAYIKDVLQNSYQFREAPDGEAGFNLAQKIVPDLIISDVMMPKMDGYQLCAKLKTDQLTSHIPVILLTARASKESKLEGLEIGADDYLIKPFDADELTVRVKNLIRQRRNLREQFAKKLAVDPTDIAVTSVDEAFLQRALQIIEEHLQDSDFSAEHFAQKMGASRMQLHLKLKGLTGQSTSEFIRTIRLKRAAQLLKQKSGSISEIAYQVGFNHLSYFAECFKKQFGVNPREFK